MHNFTVTLTDAEYLALSYASSDPSEWIENAVHERCRVSIEDIVQITISKCLETGVPIPGSREAIVTLAFDKGWVIPAANRKIEAPGPVVI